MGSYGLWKKKKERRKKSERNVFFSINKKLSSRKSTVLISHVKNENRAFFSDDSWGEKLFRIIYLLCVQFSS